MSIEEGSHRPLNARIWARSSDDWYVEPEWCSERLFQEEAFEGAIYDPCCGTGRIVVSALKAGHRAYGSDLVHRGWDSTPQNFMMHQNDHDNIVTNPPFDIARDIAIKALVMARQKVAMLLPTARLNAAHWLKETPLETIWLLTPRPSMPPGRVIMDGGKPGGGKADFCWLVFRQDYRGTTPVMKWLHRDVTP